MATDSPDVRAALVDEDVDVVLTGKAANGTARCLLGLDQLLAAGEKAPDVVVNVQGDQPALDPSHVDAAAQMVHAGWDVGTVAAPLQTDANQPRRVKVVVGPSGQGHWFSRQPIPTGGPYWMHVGVYAFTPASLRRCVAAPPWAEVADERLEQLPWLGAGLRIGVAKVNAAVEPVDTAEDLVRLRGSDLGEASR